jgi:hypothetical protein
MPFPDVITVPQLTHIMGLTAAAGVVLHLLQLLRQDCRSVQSASPLR